MLTVVAEGACGAARVAQELAAELGFGCVVAPGDHGGPPCGPQQAAAHGPGEARLVLTNGRLVGTALAAVEAALGAGLPCLVVDLRAAQDTQDVRQWLAGYGVHTLRVAGAREQEQPGLAAASEPWLRALLSAAREPEQSSVQ